MGGSVDQNRNRFGTGGGGVETSSGCTERGSNQIRIHPFLEIRVQHGFVLQHLHP